jgi:hypothetical protein
MKKLLPQLILVLLVLNSCNNNSGLSKEDKNWLEKRIIAISDSIFTAKYASIYATDKNPEEIEDEVNNFLAKNLSAEEVYRLFIAAIEKKDFVSAQRYIHSEGVYFFSIDQHIAKSDFVSKIGNRANSFLMDGEVTIDDNYNNAAGWDGDVHSPHIDFDGWIDRGGFFLEGSMIVAIDPNPESNEEDLLIELYPDNGEWRIFSVGMWYWST